MKNMQILSLLLLVATTQINASGNATFDKHCNESIEYSRNLLKSATAATQNADKKATQDAKKVAQDMIDSMHKYFTQYNELENLIAAQEQNKAKIINQKKPNSLTKLYNYIVSAQPMTQGEKDLLDKEEDKAQAIMTVAKDQQKFIMQVFSGDVHDYIGQFGQCSETGSLMNYLGVSKSLSIRDKNDKNTAIMLHDKFYKALEEGIKTFETCQNQTRKDEHCDDPSNWTNNVKVNLNVTDAKNALSSKDYSLMNIINATVVSNF